MHTIQYDVERPDQEIVDAFRTIPSTIVSDVTGNVGLTMDAGIQPAYDGIELAGTAITVKASPGDNLIIHKAITMAKPGDVLVIDCDGYTGVGHVGELMCTSCKENGVAGLVIDGGYRDSAEISGIEFPVYGRGVNPQGPLKQDPGSINVTLSCGGVNVDPGDVIVGDDDGIALVPREAAEDVLARSREKLAAEDDVRKDVADGTYLFDRNGYDEILDNVDIIGPEESVR